MRSNRCCFFRERRLQSVRVSVCPSDCHGRRKTKCSTEAWQENALVTAMVSRQTTVSWDSQILQVMSKLTNNLLVYFFSICGLYLQSVGPCLSHDTRTNCQQSSFYLIDDRNRMLRCLARDEDEDEDDEDIQMHWYIDNSYRSNWNTSKNNLAKHSAEGSTLL